MASLTGSCCNWKMKVRDEKSGAAKKTYFLVVMNANLSA